jgi:hypothetical protein
MVGAFKKTFDEFRSSYILKYQPRGVPLEGWHEIDVNRSSLIAVAHFTCSPTTAALQSVVESRLIRAVEAEGV